MRAVAGLLIGGLLLVASDALACSCARPATPAEQFASAEVVFEGGVREVGDRFNVFKQLWAVTLQLFEREPAETLEEHFQFYGIEYTFEVARMWRGPGTRTIRILTGRGGGDCGCAFQPGKRYLVYAYAGDDGVWYTGVCTRTRAVSNAAVDLEYLRTVPLLQLDR